jgi:ketosteroid isomerase-like protein
MGELLDDQVLFSNGDGSVQRDDKLDETNALSDLLKRQTQAFRAARRRDDVATMRRYLDPDPLLVNEDGVLLRGKDVFQGASAPGPKGVLSSVVMTDWVLHHSGDVAVSTCSLG